MSAKKDYFVVPKELIGSDPIIDFLMAQRAAAEKTIRDSNAALKSHILKKATEVPEELLTNLTSIQYEVLDMLVRYFEKWGQAPTFREISEYMEFKNTNSAVVAVNSLCAKGYVQRNKGAHRGIIPMFNAKRERVAIKTKPTKTKQKK